MFYLETGVLLKKMLLFELVDDKQLIMSSFTKMSQSVYDPFTKSVN